MFKLHGRSAKFITAQRLRSMCVCIRCGAKPTLYFLEQMSMLYEKKKKSQFKTLK